MHFLKNWIKGHLRDIIKVKRLIIAYYLLACNPNEPFTYRNDVSDKKQDDSDNSGRLGLRVEVEKNW